MIIDDMQPEGMSLWLLTHLSVYLSISIQSLASVRTFLTGREAYYFCYGKCPKISKTLFQTILT